MKTVSIRTGSILIALAAILAVGGLVLAWEEVDVTIDQVPQAVKDTILREAAGGKITEIERETKNGTTTFEAEFLANGEEVEIRIAENGTLLGRKVERKVAKAPPLTLEQVPAAARQALLAAAGSARITSVEREKSSSGAAVYEAEWSVNGSEFEAAVTEDGALLETEESIAADKAPPQVRAAIAKHFPGNGKVAVEKKTIIVYELEGKINGKGKELCVSASGRVHQQNGGPEGDDDDDDDDDGDDDDHDDDDDDDDDLR